MSSVRCIIDFSKNINNTNLVDHREQMNKSTCNYSNFVRPKIGLHSNMHWIGLALSVIDLSMIVPLCAGPRTWNELPFSLRDSGLSLTTFNERTCEDLLILCRVLRPRRICDIYDFFAPCINLLTYYNCGIAQYHMAKATMEIYLAKYTLRKSKVQRNFYTPKSPTDDAVKI